MFKIIKRIFALAEGDKKSLYASVIFSMLENMTIFIPYMLVFYFVYIYLNNDLTFTSVRNVSIAMLISVILRCIFRRIVDGLQSAKGLNIFARQRLKLVEHLRKLPMGYFSEGNIGNIVSVLTTDIIFAEENAMVFLGQLVSAYINLALSIIFMFYINIWLGLGFSIIVFIASIAIGHLDKTNKKHGAIRQEQFANLSNAVVQFIKGVGIIKAFGMENEDNVDLEGNFEKSKDKAIAFEKEYLLPRIFTEGSHYIGIALLILIVLILYFSGHISLEFALGMMIFAPISLDSIMVIISGVPRFDILEVGLDRYDEIMAVKELKDTHKNIELDNLDIDFSNVTFAYDKKDIIKDINFKIPEKTFTALIGPSGGGKSTITNLISRFWDVNSGKVTIGGVDIKEMPLDTLLSKISMVFQNVYLFEDTIANNIAFGAEGATYEEIVEAAKKARCHEFISNLENGYDTVVGEGGATLSGGEKQRISIARAILKDAPIVLLDEATSSVDPENELFIQEAINELVKNKTLVVIAHRLSSIKEADNILVVDDGEIVESGNHKELIMQNGIYKNLWELS
jgi:ATP-binding cassette subfamily B protein